MISVCKHTRVLLYGMKTNATHVIVAGIFGTLCWKNVMHASSYLLGINVTTFNKQQLATSGR